MDDTVRHIVRSVVQNPHSTDNVSMVSVAVACFCFAVPATASSCPRSSRPLPCGEVVAVDIAVLVLLILFDTAGTGGV